MCECLVKQGSGGRVGGDRLVTDTEEGFKAHGHQTETVTPAEPDWIGQKARLAARLHLFLQ